jgi:hydrogenase expression/formation protein HypC
MCLGIPGEVIELHPEQPDLAKVDVSGVRRMINIGLLSDDPPVPGEWVLIHVGFALSKIDEQEAAAAMQFLEGIGQAYEEPVMSKSWIDEALAQTELGRDGLAAEGRRQLPLADREQQPYLAETYETNY